MRVEKTPAGRTADFEGVVRILTASEGGRRTPPLNGIRWDIRYWHQTNNEISMVWPAFIDEQEHPIEGPLAGLLRAQFYVICDEMREFHREQARPGVGFFCVEGAKVCAAGVVTRVLALAKEGA